MNPKVSILMPVYNVEKYLREAVDSMLNQSFTDFELIVLDDCSPDGSAAILDTYTDPRIVRYRGEKNVGLANVLNVGLQMAKGEYIARMDSDDISLPNRLQFQVDYLDSHPNIDLVSVGLQQFGAKDAIWKTEEDYELTKFIAIFYTPVMHATSMWRKKRFEEANLFYHQDMVPAEDYDLWTRALLAKRILINIPIVLYKYRIHSTQTTAHPNPILGQLIPRAYIKSAYPSISEDLLSQVLSMKSFVSDKKKWQQFSRDFESINKVNGFINPKWLHNKLRYDYQNALFARLKQESLSLRIFDLRLRQMCKLLLLKLHLINI